ASYCSPISSAPYSTTHMLASIILRHSLPTRRSSDLVREGGQPQAQGHIEGCHHGAAGQFADGKGFLVHRKPLPSANWPAAPWWRSEKHTSELQSRLDLVCRLLLEKKKDDKIEN